MFQLLFLVTHIVINVAPEVIVRIVKNALANKVKLLVIAAIKPSVVAMHVSIIMEMDKDACSAGKNKIKKMVFSLS